MSGKYDVESEFPKNDARYWHDKEAFLKDIKAVEILRDELGKDIDMAKWPINWCLANKAIDSVIVGCKTVKQAESSVGAIKVYEDKN